METISINEITCPVCGGHLFDKEYIDKKLYICRQSVDMYFRCNHMLAFCKQCNKLQDEKEFGKHGDVWECKECGTICWPLTDEKRRREEILSKYESHSKKFNKVANEIENLLKNE